MTASSVLSVCMLVKLYKCSTVLCAGHDKPLKLYDCSAVLCAGHAKPLKLYMCARPISEAIIMTAVHKTAVLCAAHAKLITDDWIKLANWVIDPCGNASDMTYVA